MNLSAKVSLSTVGMVAAILCVCLGPTQLLAQVAAGKAPVIALVATVGDQVSYSRQRSSAGSNIDSTYRKTVAIPTQALNAAVLKGLDRAIEREEPLSKRLFLLWNTPADTAEALKTAHGEQRNTLLFDALLAQLRGLPQRTEWDRIEAIVPRYARSERDGLGSKLGGIGFYVQPLANVLVEFQENGDTVTTESDGASRTIDPKTGERGNYSTFVAPYFFFERITLDARTLEVLARKSHFDNTKYHDPNSTATDIADQMPLAEMFTRLATLMEQSAFRSVRGVRPEVLVSPLLPAPATSDPSVPLR